MMRARASLLDALRRLAGRPRLVPLTALLLRARTVRPAGAFVLRAVLGRDGTFVYRLRETGLRVAIRHGTGDVVTLGEVFHEHDYRPTAEAREHLGRVARVVDLGANIGLFGAFAASYWPQAEIVAYEPDPANATLHESTVAMNGLESRWRLVRAAAGTQAGNARFFAGDIALSRLAGGEEDGETIEVPVEDVMTLLSEADLVKMDIEGGEWAILRDQRFREAPPRTLVLEYHPRLCGAVDPHAEAQSALTAAGMRIQTIWRRADGYGMLWAWKT